MTRECQADQTGNGRELPLNQVVQADALTYLRGLPDGCVDVCITSSPYLGLRSYQTNPQVWPAEDGRALCAGEHEWQMAIRKGTTGGTASAKVQIKGAENFQIVPDGEVATCTVCGAERCELGSEGTPESFIWHLVLIFREVRRVLKDTGTCWANWGDSYWNNPGGGEGMTTGNRAGGASAGRQQRIKPHPVYKPKDLMGLPWRCALALQADGWYLRSAAPWIKRSALPESVTDRPSSALEYWFQLTKRPTYFYDPVSVRKRALQPVGTPSLVAQHKRAQLHQMSNTTTLGTNQGATTRNRRNTDSYFESLDEVIAQTREHLAHLEAIRDGGVVQDEHGGILALDIVTASSKLAHFASFSPELIRPLVRASSSERGCCSVCGKPWDRVVERTASVQVPVDGKWASQDDDAASRRMNENRSGARQQPGRDYDNPFPAPKSVGWRPTCTCPEASIVPARVLDPFMGTGTTALVAQQEGRDYLGCELSPEYKAMCDTRLAQKALPLTAAVPTPAAPHVLALPGLEAAAG